MKGKAKLARIFGLRGNTDAKQDSLSDLYHTAVERKTARIVDYRRHPLFSQFQRPPSGRRYKVPITRKNVYKKSLPSATLFKLVRAVYLLALLVFRPQFYSPCANG